MLNLLLALALVAEPSYPAGIEIHESDCASGGFDWFFFADGTVIAACSGCETVPHVQVGTWKRDGSSVDATMTREWFGYGRGGAGAASVYVFGDYVAIWREHMDGTLQGRIFKAEEFAATGKDSCDFARKHARSPDPHAFLRQFEGDHPVTFWRLLQPDELKALAPDELRAMRNEIFARYGYRFKDPALTARFSKFKGYHPRMSSVDDFLSEIEQENVKRLAAAEDAARGKRGR